MKYRQLPHGNPQDGLSVLGLGMGGIQNCPESEIEDVVDGTLNYYSEQMDGIDITVEGDTARLVGQSSVNAAVFGGGRHTWRLQLTMSAVKRDGHWHFTGANASTY